MAVAIIQGLPPVGEIVRLPVAVRDFDPLVPVTVIVPLPAGALAAVVIVKVAVPMPFGGGVTAGGFMLPVAPDPDGRLTVSVTGELKALIELMFIVNVVDEPFRTVCEDGTSVSE